jgi:TonB family protein
MSFVNLSSRLVGRLTIAIVLLAACGRGRGAQSAQAIKPDSLPVFIGDSLPFQYPPGPYIQRIQDNVTLRLYLDEFGRPVNDSTRIHAHAALPAFDTAALNGARDLVFRPAMKDGKAMPFAVLFPIKFRVPDGPPMPGDDTTSVAPKR